MPATYRERLSDRLLSTGIELGAEREQMLRSIRSAARDQYEFERAAGPLALAAGVDTLLRWLATRLRPKSA